MIQRIGSAGGASLAQAAIEAALKAHADAAKRIEAQLAGATNQVSPADSSATNFTRLLADGVRSANAQVNQVDALPSEMVSGKISDFHEVAALIKQSELTFKFSLEVRNKLIDAYRETMRMSV